MDYKNIMKNIVDYTKNKLSEYRDKFGILINSDEIDFYEEEFDESPILIYNIELLQNKKIVNLSIKLELYFYASIFKDIRNINFNINKNINYENMSYIQYIYEVNKNKIIYTFNGFYRDGYLIITIDSYDEYTQVNLEHKEVIIIKLNWKLIVDNNGKEYYHLSDIQRKINKYAILDIRRNKLLNEKNITIDDYLSILSYKANQVSIYFNNET
jgi:hypothetical protein